MTSQGPQAAAFASVFAAPVYARSRPSTRIGGQVGIPDSMNLMELQAKSSFIAYIYYKSKEASGEICLAYIYYKLKESPSKISIYSMN